jgi:hypothetical protein
MPSDCPRWNVCFPRTAEILPSDRNVDDAKAVFSAMEKPSLIGPKARVPNRALQQLQFLVGEWRTTGSHPMVPGTQLHGRASFAWHEGGAFLVMRSQVDAPKFPDGIAIIGSDDAAGTFAMIYFDERGTSRLMQVTVGEQTITWRHDNPKFAQSTTIRADGDRLVSKGRMSENDGPWTEDLSQTYERATD